MINATGNNFGAGAISFKAYSTADIVVLNGKVEVDASAPEFLAASQLEIYVPDLPMRKSASTAVFMVMKRQGTLPFATIVESRIKNYNTIVIEKVRLYQYYGNFSLVFACAYVPKGEVGPFAIEGGTSITASSENATVNLYRSSCVIRDHWVSLFAQFNSLNGPERTDPFSFTIPQMPSDIAADVPIVVHSGSGYDGSVIMMAEVSGQTFNVPSPSYDAGMPYGTKFIKAFFVRGDNE